MKRLTLLLLVFMLGCILRFYQLGLNPPSVSWDEASLGYNAYTIATSGMDEFGERYPLARFIAFGDYKPPGYIYADVPFVKLLGLNEFSVRAPSALAGILMILLTYLIARELFVRAKIALLAAYAFAISPWSLHLSRAAYEANLAAFFNLAAVYFFLRSKKSGWLIVVSTVFFICAFYTFNANRITAPLLLAALALWRWRMMLKNWRWSITAAVLALIMISPSFSYLASKESKLRFQEVSIFNNLEPVKLSNSRIEYDENAPFAKLIHNRRLLFAVDYLKHYSDNFSGRFLFTHGDVNPRLSVQGMGELYLIELPFLIAGILILIIKKHRALVPLVLWILIAPIPAATARETPHALRIISILPVYQLLIAVGTYWVLNMLKRLPGKQIILSTMVVCSYVSIFYYLHTYYIHFPKTWSGEWQYGYKEMVHYVTVNQSLYDNIFVSDGLGRPYIFFAFHNSIPIERFLTEKKASRDWYGFWTVTNLGNIHFGFSELPKTRGKTLIVTQPGTLPSGYHSKTEIRNLANDIVFIVGDNL